MIRLCDDICQTSIHSAVPPKAMAYDEAFDLDHNPL